MQHIDRPSNDFRVASGWSSLAYVLPSWVDSLVLPNVGIATTNPTLKAGREWMRIAFTHRSVDFGDDVKQSEHGPIHQIKITGFVPRTDVVALTTFAEMVQHEDFILKVKNHDLEYRLVGSIEEYAKFSYKESNSNGPGTRKGLMFEFSGEFSRAALFLQ